MQLTLIQMTMRPLDPQENFAHAEALIRRAAAEGADTVLLPETWNTGFVTSPALRAACDRDGRETKARFSSLARALGINLAAGSVAVDRGDCLTNTAYVFDRTGACVAEYDKLHLFTLMGEEKIFRAGSAAAPIFPLDGHPCGLITCYDLRFPELARTLALAGAELLLVPAQWPLARVGHYELLLAARAVENQLFTAGCNSCGVIDGTAFGGSSRIVDPLGAVLAAADNAEEALVTARLDFAALPAVRAAIPIYRDRRPEAYRL